MVDGSAAIQITEGVDQRRADAAVHFTATVRTGAAALDVYAALCKRAAAAPAQGAAWVRAWAENSSPEPLLVFLGSAGRPVLGLALEIADLGPFRIARFMAGRHANGNFPATAPDALPTLAPDHLHALMAAVRQARPDIDMIALERQAERLAGFPNPLLSLPHRKSPNPALAVDLAGGFDALLERSSGKRKRKKHRSQIRRFEAAGGYRRFQASTSAETERLLSAFFTMKRKRFLKMGIADVFAEPRVQASLRQVYASAVAEPRPPFVLHGLEVAGKLRAVSGSSICGDRIICDFAAIAEDELSAASPGDFLFFENIREACELGFAVYDFSVGDEPYKRHWCDIETVQFDVILPLTAKGRVLTAATHASSAAKRMVKRNPALWALAKRMRRSRIGSSEFA